jgi:stress-induced morphogen
MAIKGIPDAYDELERLTEDYEHSRFQRTEASERVGRATRDMFLAWFPGLPKRFGAPAIYALMDDRLLDAFGFPRPPRALRSTVEGALRTRGRAVALLPPRRRPRLRTRRRTRTYGRTWRLEELGPRSYDPAVATDPLETLLHEAFPDATELAVVDRTGGGDHFQVTVASPRFDGLSLVDQHRLVYDALAAPLADGTIHELRIKTKGPA